MNKTNIYYIGIGIGIVVGAGITMLIENWLSIYGSFFISCAIGLSLITWRFIKG